MAHASHATAIHGDGHGRRQARMLEVDGQVGTTQEPVNMRLHYVDFKPLQESGVKRSALEGRLACPSWGFPVHPQYWGIGR